MFWLLTLIWSNSDYFWNSSIKDYSMSMVSFRELVFIEYHKSINDINLEYDILNLMILYVVQDTWRLLYVLLSVCKYCRLLYNWRMFVRGLAFHFANLLWSYTAKKTTLLLMNARGRLIIEIPWFNYRLQL